MGELHTAIFIPAPPYQLVDDAVDELALVRVQHGDEIIDERYTVGVLADLVLRASRFKSGYRLLDVGCGDGIIVKCLERLPANTQPEEIIGVDSCKDLVQIADNRLKQRSIGHAIWIARDAF